MLRLRHLGSLLFRRACVRLVRERLNDAPAIFEMCSGSLRRRGRLTRRLLSPLAFMVEATRLAGVWVSGALVGQGRFRSVDADEPGLNSPERREQAV